MQDFNLNIPRNHIISLPQTQSWPASVHLLDEPSIYAIKAALAAARPLLVRGEPGTGKSQLARAAAQCLGRLFIAEVVHARGECQDLQWHFDAVRRLGDAQIAATGRNASDTLYREEQNYLSPGALWWAFDYPGALAQFNRCHRTLRPPPEKPTLTTGEWTEADGCVLLIDEIDKADADLPNGLLETLGNGAFTVPWLDRAVGHNPAIASPLVMITTNEERSLPPAFLRRCLVLHLRLPDGDALLTHLALVGEAHFGSDCDPEVYREVAQQLAQDREAAQTQGLPLPGQAEYLDLLRVLSRLAKGRPRAQLELLAKIKDFALKKQTAESW